MGKVIKDDDPIFALHEYGIDLSNLEIYLMSSDQYSNGCLQDEVYSEPGVEFTMANKFIKNLNVAVASSKNGSKYRPLIIHMKTCGGDWSEGMAIYDAIKACPNHVTIVNYTHARSMSSIILQAADRRIMMPNSIFMYHEGDWGMSGTMKKVKSNWEFDEASNEIMLDVYASQMRLKGKFKGNSKTKIKMYLKGEMDKKEDVFLTASQAVNTGLADEIFNSWKSVRRGK